MSVFKTPVYRDSYVNSSDGLMDTLLSQYNSLRYHEQDKQQQLSRNRQCVQQMTKPNTRNPTPRFPELSKPQTFAFQRIEILMMKNQPIFTILQSTQRRPPLILEEPVAKQRIIQEKLCPCCGNFGKKHSCLHSQCQKPCKILEKKKKMSTKRVEDREKSRASGGNGAGNQLD